MKQSFFFGLLEKIFDYLDLNNAARIYLRSIYIGFGTGLFLVCLAKLYRYWYIKKYCSMNLLTDSKKKSVDKLTEKRTIHSIIKYRGGLTPAAFLAAFNAIAGVIENGGIIYGAISGAIIGAVSIRKSGTGAEVSEFFKHITPESMYASMQLERMQKAARALEPVQGAAVIIECCRRFNVFKYLINQLPDRDLSLQTKKQAIDDTLHSKRFLQLISENRGMATTVSIAICIAGLLEYVYYNDRELFIPFLTDLMMMVKNGKLRLIIFRALIRVLRKAGVMIPASVDEFLEELENLQELDQPA